MEEIFDVYARDGKYLGTKPKSFCHRENPGVYHKPVWIWIINSNNEILVQKRATCKKNNPDKWDMPSAGHVHAGEKIIDGAIREIFEELGVLTKENDFEFIYEYIDEKTFEIAQVYLLHLDLNIDELKLQQEEVSEVKWLKIDEFQKLFYSDQFVKFNDDYREIIINVLKKHLK